MPPLTGTVITTVISITVGTFVFGGAMLLLANLGGLLERAASPSWISLPFSYWPSHLIKALSFSVPTGLIVLLIGLHLRACIVVTTLTCFGIYLSSGSYAYMGQERHPSNLSGVFDWILGYEVNPMNTSFHLKFLRDCAGMSLRGLTWTVPQGYALQHMGFGWQYSLSGSMMGLIYYIGSKTGPTTTAAIFSTQQAFSQYYWGCWLWFVLMASCGAQLVHRIRVWIYRKSPYLGFRPFSRWEQIKYDSLNYSFTMILYEVLLSLLNVILAVSLVFYSLVNEDNYRAKGQTFFCLFSSVLFLAFAQGWVWNGLCRYWKQNKTRCWSRPPLDHFGVSLEVSGTLQKPRRVPIKNVADENVTLLWPHAHHERSHHGRLVLPEGGIPTNSSLEDHPCDDQRRVSRVGAAFLIFWPEVEKWLWMDIFAWIRHIVGFLSLLTTLITIVFVITAAILDRKYPRYGGAESTLQ